MHEREAVRCVVSGGGGKWLHRWLVVVTTTGVVVGSKPGRDGYRVVGTLFTPSRVVKAGVNRVPTPSITSISRRT